MAARKPADGSDVVTTEDLTPDEATADVQDVKYVKVKAPSGHVTEIPIEIKKALLDSGYTVTK